MAGSILLSACNFIQSVNQLIYTQQHTDQHFLKTRFTHNANEPLHGYKGRPVRSYDGTLWVATMVTLAILSCIFCYLLLYYSMAVMKLYSEKVTAPLVKFYYWPMLLSTVVKVYCCCGRFRWYSKIDDHVYLGMVPIKIFNSVSHLYNDLHVRGVVNMMAEDAGPQYEYKKYGIEQLHLPTVDHFSPSKEQLVEAVQFIDRITKDGGNVYVHCKAGHGRSAAVAMAWLMSHKNMGLFEAQEHLSSLRKVRKRLYTQEPLQEYSSLIASNAEKTEKNVVI